MLLKQFTHNGKKGDGSVMPGFEESPGLGIGTIREDFQLLGNIPVESDMLKSAVIIGVIEGAVPFNMRADILSSPEALLTSSEEIRW